MKRAYIDITIEGLNDLLKLYPTDGEHLVKSVEMSPLGEQQVRLHLEGDRLPDTYSEEPRRACVDYEHIYDESFPFRGVKVTIYDREHAGDPASTSVIHDGKPPRVSV